MLADGQNSAAGNDFKAAIKSFKQSMKEDREPPSPDAGEGDDAKKIKNNSGRVIDAEVTSKQKHKT